MIVLDTHVIIWDALKPEFLSESAKTAIHHANETDGMIFCEISLWEIAMLVQKERIIIDTSYQEFIKLILMAKQYRLQGITPAIAELSTQFPEDVNKDPVDRIIGSTAIIQKVSLVTKDKNLIKAGYVSTIW